MVQMQSLEKLHLDNNVLTELPQYVTLQLPQLRALTLENNKVSFITSIFNYVDSFILYSFQYSVFPAVSLIYPLQFKDSQDHDYNSDTLASRRKFFYKIGVTDHSLAQN